MYDDKYPDEQARSRLFDSVRLSLQQLFDWVPDCDTVIHLLWPSDDCYDVNTVTMVKKALAASDIDAVSYRQGYICNYNTLEVKQYNPSTNPPFAAIRFNRDVFFDPSRHLQYISTKRPTEKYPVGTPLPSHEYLPDCFRVAYLDWRGFLVGTHGENISTHFNHPFGTEQVSGVLEDFGLKEATPLILPVSLRKKIMRHLPFVVQRKLRYWIGEKVWAKYYSWIRN